MERIASEEVLKEAVVGRLISENALLPKRVAVKRLVDLADGEAIREEIVKIDKHLPHSISSNVRDLDSVTQSVKEDLMQQALIMMNSELRK